MSPSFIGVGQYYGYNQLKYNIVISKSIQQLSKQLVVPAYQIIDRLNSQKKSTRDLVLYPSVLPMSVRLKAKQLFDSQYVLNRRRLYNVAIYTTRLLKQRFEKNYSDFTESTGKLTFSSETKGNPSKEKPALGNFSKYQKWKSKKLSFDSLCPSVTFARAFFRSFRKPFLEHDTKGNLNNQRIYTKKKTKQLQQTKKRKTESILFPRLGCDPYLMLSYGAPFISRDYPIISQKLKVFSFLTKSTEGNENRLNLGNPAPFVKSPGSDSISYPALTRLGAYPTFKKHKSINYLANTKPLFHRDLFQCLGYLQNKTNTIAGCSEWPVPATFSPGISFTDYTHWQKFLYSITIKTKIKATLAIGGKEIQDMSKAKNRKTPSQKSLVNFSSESRDSSWTSWAFRDLCAKPTISHQVTRRFVLLYYLSLSVTNLAYNQELRLKKVGKPTIATPLTLAKEVANKQKRLYINSVPINKGAVFPDLRQNKISYTFCPRSSAASFNLKNIKKLTRQIEHFRSDIKLLAPLGLLLNRSFSEPVGINCISAVDSQLGKTYGNQFLKNLLFRRTPDNFLKSNYMNTQKGLLRTKDTVFFDFAYTKDSLIKLGLKKTNTLMQQLLETGHRSLWLRKLSSVRL